MKWILIVLFMSGTAIGGSKPNPMLIEVKSEQQCRYMGRQIIEKSDSWTSKHQYICVRKDPPKDE